jgi:biopolymer transport protein ExbB/TolQ
MSLLNQFLDLMNARLCNQLLIESNKAAVACCGAGQFPETTEVFSHAQLSSLLAEILPAELRGSLNAGWPARFRHRHEGAVLDFDVVPNNGSFRVSVERAVSAGGPGPSPGPAAVSSSVAGPPDTGAAAFLNWSERKIRLCAASLGVVLGLGLSLGFYFLADKQSLLGRMFNFNEVQALVPMSITCMFLWAGFLCLLRWVRLGRLELVSGRQLLIEAIKLFSNKPLVAAAKELEDRALPGSPLFRRLTAVLWQWQIRPSLQDAGLMLQQHMVTDEDSVRGAYSLLRTFVWALPVLGLIGTVIGISFAVGGFAQFLAGNVDDVATIKKSLVGVTGGLSFAFLITLQGLLTSLLVMLPTAALQAREEKLYANLQQDITDLFLPALQHAFPESALPSDAREHQAFRETLQAIAEGVIHKVGEISLRLMNQVEQTQTRHNTQVGEWAEKLQKELESGATRLGDVVGRLGHDLETASTEFLARLSMVRESWDEHTRTLRQLVDEQARSNVQIHEELVQATSAQTTNAQSICQNMARLGEVTAATLEAHAALQTALRDLSRSKLDQTMIAAATALDNVAQQTRSASDAVVALSRTTEHTMASQRTLQDAMRQLHDMGLPNSLAEFSTALGEVGRVLTNFQEPIVFTPVPVKQVLRSREQTTDGVPQRLS